MTNLTAYLIANNLKYEINTAANTKNIYRFNGTAWIAA